jgi:hypothetical protein
MQQAGELVQICVLNAIELIFSKKAPPIRGAAKVLKNLLLLKFHPNTV